MIKKSGFIKIQFLGKNLVPVRYCCTLTTGRPHIHVFITADMGDYWII